MLWAVLVVICAVAIVALGSVYFTLSGQKRWYGKINRPAFTPPGKIFGLVWTVMYVLTGLSLYKFIAATVFDQYFWLVMTIFVINGILNILWSFTFFTAHLVYGGFFVALGMALTILSLIILIIPYSVISSLLLVPYFLWICFASYLNYQIWVENGYKLVI